MFKKRTIISLCAICIMAMSGLSVVNANTYVVLPQIFEVDNVSYEGSEFSSGIYNIGDMDQINLRTTIYDPVIIEEELLDLSIGISRRLTLNTQVKMETMFEINDEFTLVRTEQENNWLYTSELHYIYYSGYTIPIFNDHYFTTNYTSDELICEILPSINGVFNMDMSYSYSKFHVTSSKSRIINNEVINTDSILDDINIPVIMPSKDLSVAPSDPIFDTLGWDNESLIRNSAITPYNIISNEYKAFQSENIEINNLYEDASSQNIRFSMDLDLTPSISSNIQEIQPIMQYKEYWTNVVTDDPSNVRTPYGVGGGITADAPYEIISNVKLVNIEYIFTIESIVEIDIKDPNLIINLENNIQTDNIYMNADGDIITQVYTNANGDIVDETGEVLQVVIESKDNTIIYAIISIIGIAVIGITYAFIKKFKR